MENHLNAKFREVDKQENMFVQDDVAQKCLVA